MKILITLFKWLWRAWPVLSIVSLELLRNLLVANFPHHSGSINNTIARMCQVIGPLSILYTININVGIIKQKSLISIAGDYFKNFPLIKRPPIHGTCNATIPSVWGGFKATAINPPKIIEEKIDYLQEQINNLKNDINYLYACIENINTYLQKRKDMIAEFATGSINLQVFGVLITWYGVYASIL